MPFSSALGIPGKQAAFCAGALSSQAGSDLSEPAWWNRRLKMGIMVNIRKAAQKIPA